MSMISLITILLVISCLAVMLVLGGIAVALWLQNRSTDQDFQAPPPTTSPADWMGGQTPEQPAALTGDWQEQIHSLLQSGKKIEAIKIYRQATGVGLKEAKDAVEALERGEPIAISEAPAAVSSGDLEADVRAALAQGSKIEAIKIYRQATGLGLKEAKDAVEAMERGETLAAPPPQPTPALIGSLDAQVRDLLASGKKIEAIKIYREATGLGLKEAKDAVEAIEREI